MYDFNSSRGPPLHTRSKLQFINLFPLGNILVHAETFCSLSCSHNPLQLPPFLLPVSRAWMCGCHHMIQSTRGRRDLEPLRTLTRELSISAKTLP